MCFLTALTPVSGRAADVSSKVAELDKRVSGIKTDHTELEHKINERLKALETKLGELEKTIVPIVTKQQSIDEVAKKTMEAADMSIKFVGGIFSVLGIAGGILAFVGFTEFKRMREQREVAQRALESAILIGRASQSLIQADVTPDEHLKKMRVLAALSIIEEALKSGFNEPAIYNWQAFALKRLGNTSGALQAAENVFSKGNAREGSYEYRRGLYNKACYLTLLAKDEVDKDKAYEALRGAITGDYHLGQIALLDSDLSGLDQQKLKSLVDKCT